MLVRMRTRSWFSKTKASTINLFIVQIHIRAFMYLDTFKRYQTQVHVSAVQRWETNRCAGGWKTQKFVIKSWNIGRHFIVFFVFCLLIIFAFLSKVFLQHALEAGKVRDDIVDEHSLLLLIDFLANHCRRDRCGEYIPGTRIGAVRAFLHIILVYLLTLIILDYY